MEIQFLDICLAGLALYLVKRLLQKRNTPLPPGPPGWPLIGNLLDLSTHVPHKTFGAMSEKYGPIVFFTIVGKQFVALSTLKTTNDVLVKKAAATSNRPNLTMGGDLVGWGNATGLIQYSDIYRKHRKFFRQQIGTKSSLKAFYPAGEAEAKQLLRNVLKNPDDLIAHNCRMGSSMILKISHGYTAKEDGDQLLEMANKAMHSLCIIATPGRFLVDTFPILRYLPEWFPGGSFHKEAKQWRKLLNETVYTPYEFVLEHMAKGDASPSFISRQLQQGVTPEEEEILKWASFSMYVGGSDTTPIALSAFFLAMTIYPEILKKAQEELDSVVGNERLPTFEDRDALPYVNAICLELLRWHVVIPFTVHVSTQDILYEGYLIPKGTSIFGNLWFIMSNPETYPDPDLFDPERFLGEHQQPDPRETCFGYGKRSCPGAYLAESTVFICVAMALATLDVSRCVENGVEVVPGYDATEGIIRRIKPFKCRIAPRSEKVENLLRG